jgi:hypothetical protein
LAQTLCIKCGSELKASSYCHLCQEPLIFACTSCDYITEEKIHTDCKNAEVLAKTASTTEVSTAAANATTTTKTSRPITGNQEESIRDKPKQETVKAELGSAQSYMTTKQDNNNNKSNSDSNVNPFAAGTALWQSLMTYWLNAYGEFFKNAPKMTEEWYNMFWEPWINWMAQQQQRQNRD